MGWGTQRTETCGVWRAPSVAPGRHDTAVFLETWLSMAYPSACSLAIALSREQSALVPRGPSLPLSLCLQVHSPLCGP